MSQPAQFRIVTYKVAGSATYVGELIITERVIYFFPQTEFTAIFYTVGYLGWGILWGTLGLVTLLITPFLMKDLATNPAESLLKRVVVDPLTPAGQLAHKQDVEHYSSLAEIENSYPKPKLDVQFLWPIISYPELWYPLILDSLIAQLKDTQTISAESLPSPARFVDDAIKGIRVTMLGNLILETDFDMIHRFRIGLIRKAKLKTALMHWNLLF